MSTRWKWKWNPPKNGMVGMGMHLVSAPPAHDRRREVLGHASHRVAHLRGFWHGRERHAVRHGGDGRVPVPATEQSMSLCFARQDFSLASSK